MIDVHCHLNFHRFEHDCAQVIQHAKEKGVEKIINVGTSLESSHQAVKLAEDYENLYAIVGIHPHHADTFHEKKPLDQKAFTEPLDWIIQLETLTKHPKVLAIGEIGLDYFSYQSNGIVDPQKQKEVFIDQIRLASHAKLPIQIHNRLAGEDVVAILKEHSTELQAIPGMFHCFASSHAVLKQILAMGFYIGFDGNLTYPGLAPKETVELEDLARETPLNRIVCETDSPYLTPIPYRGQRNEPANVIIVAEAIARIKGVALTDVLEQTTQNTYTLFSKLNK